MSQRERPSDCISMTSKSGVSYSHCNNSRIPSSLGQVSHNDLRWESQGRKSGGAGWATRRNSPLLRWQLD